MAQSWTRVVSLFTLLAVSVSCTLSAVAVDIPPATERRDSNYFVIKDIKALYDNFGIIPIIAHVERYFPARGYKKLLKLIENGECVCQINASSFFSRNFSKAVRKLVKGGYAQVIASDSHSVSKRPPKIEAALNEIKTEIGEKYYNNLLKSQAALKKSILGD